MTKGILKCFFNNNQYNLVRENNTFKIYCDFGRVLFEICTDDEQKAVEQFKDFFGKSATFEKFYFGFND